MPGAIACPTHPGPDNEASYTVLPFASLTITLTGAPVGGIETKNLPPGAGLGYRPTAASARLSPLNPAATPLSTAGEALLTVTGLTNCHSALYQPVWAPAYC